MSWALPRIRVGADSRPETLLRLLITSVGLPEPELRHPIVVESGRVLHPDLVFAQVKVALEYEGDVHRVDRGTWLNDIERREALELAGWRVVRVTSRDLFEYPELFIARLRLILGDRSR
jgi:very-short-patch-repair endonuclease